MSQNWIVIDHHMYDAVNVVDNVSCDIPEIFTNVHEMAGVVGQDDVPEL